MSLSKSVTANWSILTSGQFFDLLCRFILSVGGGGQDGAGMDGMGTESAAAVLGHRRSSDNSPAQVLTLEHFGVLGHGGTETQ